MVDDQASLKIQNINRQFTAMGNQVGTTQGRINSFNSAINNNSRTFTASANAIKTQGNALANNTRQLTANSTQFTTLGSKIKSTAGQFAGMATGIAVTTSGALQLAAGFRDYNDAQIAVDRVTRKLSLATEAQSKAQDKLKALQAKGIKSGKEYAQAQLDVSQANAAVSIQTDLLGEAQERMFDSQTQFVASVIPTTLGAIGTLGSAFKDLGGDKGLGGLTAKFKGLGGTIAGSFPSLSGLTDRLKGAGGAATGLKGNLLGLGITTTVIGGVTFAAIELGNAMNALAKHFSNVKQPVSALESTLDKSGKSLKTWNLTVAETEAAARAGVSPAIFAMDAIFGTHMTENILKSAGALDKHGKIIVDFDKKVKLIPPTMNAAANSTDAWVNMMIKALQSSDPKKIIEFNKAFKESGQSTERYRQILELATAAIDENKKSVIAATKPLQTLTDNWKLQTQSLQGGTIKNLNLATRAYLDVHDTIVKTNPAITENITKTKEQNEMQKQMAKTLGNLSNSYRDQKSTMLGLGAPLDVIIAKFKALRDAVKQIPTKEAREMDTLLKNWGGGKLTQTAERSKELAANLKTATQHARDLVTNANNVQPAIAKAKEEAARFKEIMASSDKAFKGLFKIDSNVDKMFKDLVKGLPNKIEKKLKLKLKFEQNVEDARQAFQDFLGRATKVDDKTADKMGQEVIDMIDKKFKGKKGALAGLRAAIEAAIADPNTPEKLRQLLINMKPPEIPIHIIPPAQILPPIKEPVKVPAVLTPPPPITPPKEPVKVPSTLNTPPPIPSPKTPVKVPSLFNPPPPIPSPKTPVKVPAVLTLVAGAVRNLITQANKIPVKIPIPSPKKETPPPPFPHGQPENKKNPPLTEWDRTHYLGNPWDIQNRMGLFGKTKKGPITAQQGTQLGDEQTDFFFGRPLEGRTKRPKPIIPNRQSVPNVIPSSSGGGGSGGTAAARNLITQSNKIPVQMSNAKPQINIEMALKQIDILAQRIIGLAKIIPAISVNNTAALKQIDALAIRLVGFSSIIPSISVNNTMALKLIDAVAMRILSLTSVKAAISLTNTLAIKIVDAVAKRILGLEKIKPNISISNTQALKIVDAVGKRIDALEKIKPSINISNTEALKRVDAVAKRINSLSDINPTVASKGDTSGSKADSGDTIIQVNVMDETIMRRITARSGRNRFTMGV